MDNYSSNVLLARCQTGDEDAAQAVFDRYLKRLLALTRRRISPKMRPRIDPEDVVQSAYRSFFTHARQGEFVLRRAGDLWRLLAAITLHKLRSQAQFHSAQKRDVHLETTRADDFGDGSSAASSADLFLDREPSPEESAEVVEQLRLAMQELSTAQRRALQLRLAGMKIEQIAQELGRSQRTVRRFLNQARAILERRLHEARNFTDK